MLKAKDLRDKAVEELNAMLEENRKELFHLVNDLGQAKKLEKPHKLYGIKRDIARLLTVIKEKQSATA